MKIAIIVGAENKDFFQSIGAYLSKFYHSDVTFLVRNKYVKRYIEKKVDNLSEIILIDEYIVKNKETDLKLIARTIERDHNVTISSLIAQDRGLGQGYFFNTPYVPHIKRSSWGCVDKANSIASDYIKFVELLSGKDVLIQQYPEMLIKIACDKVNCSSLSLVQSRFGSRYLWSDNNYLTSTELILKLQSELETYTVETKCIYEKDSGGLKIINEVSFSLLSKFKKSLYVAYNETKKIVKGNFKKDSYIPYGWIPVAFRSWSNYNFLKKISISSNNLKNKKIIFWTMNLEPEVSLYLFSPEFSNAIEAIVWISKSININTVIVIKEHPLALGVRSKETYKAFSKMANVYLADPASSSEMWLKKSSIVATITGTIGYEAVYSKVPVISFGKHQLINYLPSVEYVTNFDETQIAIKKLLDVNKYDLSKSLVALHRALLDQSFEISFYTKQYLEEDEKSIIGKLSVDRLISSYPEIFKELVVQLNSKKNYN
jgi:hypothetical protein